MSSGRWATISSELDRAIIPSGLCNPSAKSAQLFFVKSRKKISPLGRQTTSFPLGKKVSPSILIFLYFLGGGGILTTEYWGAVFQEMDRAKSANRVGSLNFIS